MISQQLILETETPMPTHRLLMSVAGTGKQKGPFRDPKHVHAWRLEDPQGTLIAANNNALLELLDGADNFGLYEAMEEALSWMPDGSVVLLLAPQEEVYWVFCKGLVTLRARGYRKTNGKPYAHRDRIMKVDQLARNRNIELFSREPCGDEVEALLTIADDARDRLHEAIEQENR
ncbi:hypothetical protein [Rhizobium miluonense]|uniref:Uncharacterized protein n=1 Tax=Rhizobium miluonense TaxID=411945 RepID=A0ABU1SZ04_9HYPH|nr:hypothetical protein [Rhizobium miluonense]MDR6904211.1 hypothetical protein [Rhizobium miluonense]